MFFKPGFLNEAALGALLLPLSEIVNWLGEFKKKIYFWNQDNILRLSSKINHKLIFTPFKY